MSVLQWITDASNSVSTRWVVTIVPVKWALNFIQITNTVKVYIAIQTAVDPRELWRLIVPPPPKDYRNKNILLFNIFTSICINTHSFTAKENVLVLNYNDV